MQILHCLFMPFIIFFFSVLLQLWLDTDEFTDFYKLVGLGIITGILIRIITYFFLPIFSGKSYFVTVLFESLFIHGLLFTLLATAGLWYLLQFHIGQRLTLTWSMTSIVSIGFFGGIFTIYHIFDALSGSFPNSPLYYTSFIPALVLIALTIGFGLPRFIDSYVIWQKMLWGVFCVMVPALILAAMQFLYFFNYPWLYLSAALLVPVAVLFEIYDFKMFRH